MQELGLGDRVIIDLGLVNLAEYYTGIIFRGYFHGIGEQVLSGGRYDQLLHDFGVEECSVGFGINVDLASQKVKTVEENIPEVLVFACHRIRSFWQKQSIIAENWKTRAC